MSGGNTTRFKDYSLWTKDEVDREYGCDSGKCSECEKKVCLKRYYYIRFRDNLRNSLIKNDIKCQYAAEQVFCKGRKCCYFDNCNKTAKKWREAFKKGNKELLNKCLKMI